MPIVWTQNLSVGVDPIDRQHQKLFEKANELFEAGQARKSKEFIVEMLDFLDVYTKHHFHDEEKYMESIRYPGLEIQKKMHADFIAQITDFRKEYLASDGNVVQIINFNQMIVQWLTNHISFVDRKIGEYAKTLNR